MKEWPGLLAAEFAKLRRLVVFRAVVLSLLIGPGVMILVLRLVATDITNIVASPLEVVLGSVVLLAAFGGVVLSAAILGREFDWGTARAQLLRGVSRSGFLLAKLVAALLAVSVTSLLASAIGVAETVLVGWGTTIPQATEALVRTLGLVPLASLAYVGVTFLGAILGRSAAAGTLAGLALFLGDFLLATLRIRVPLGEWLPVTNLFALLGGTFALVLPPGISPLAGAAVARLVAAGLALLLSAWFMLERQDLTR